MRRNRDASETDGDSWPLFILPTGADRRDGKLFIQVVGRYPIPEASVLVVHAGEVGSPGGGTLLARVLGPLPVGVSEGPMVQLPAGDVVDLDILTWPRSRMCYTQQIRMRWRGDHWANAHRVLAVDRKTLYQGFSDDFPNAVLEAQGWDRTRRDRLDPAACPRRRRQLSVKRSTLGILAGRPGRGAYSKQGFGLP